jgi:hypothetical protein
MKPARVLAAAFGLAVAAVAAHAPAETILYSFAALPGPVDTCKWFDDNLNGDRSIAAIARQTDLLYNRVALPADAPIATGGTATTDAGAQVVDFTLGGKRLCAGAEAIYGPTPSPSTSPTPLPT